jgi:protein O-mannosyl-transferase
LTSGLGTHTLLSMPEPRSKSYALFICAALVVSTVLAYLPTANSCFTNYDDNDYILNNPPVAGGLSADSVIWAFTATHSANWHPLTWLSHMLDCSLFGLKPGPMHIVSLLLHLANTLLLFAILRWMTAALWPSAFVAAAFALHPAHVESVAWIAERKDLLSALFMFLTIAAYVDYTRRPSVPRYVLALVLFAMGLMSKPMLVTLPLVLLLLDYWPLTRLNRHSVIEKVPFLILSALSSVVTFIVQHSFGAIINEASLPLRSRLANALLAYARYVGLALWPHDLAVFYPFDLARFSAWHIVLSAIFLLVVSVAAILLGRRYRYLPVGWLWFLGMMVPVIGLVQVGGQALADRYTYIPFIGLFIIVAWGLPQLVAGWKYYRPALACAAAAALVSMALATHRQLSFWHDDVTLFSHAVEVTKDNAIMFNCLAAADNELHRYDDAIVAANGALRTYPNYAEAWDNLGTAQQALGRIPEAADAYKRAVDYGPNEPDYRLDLANALARQGRISEALRQYRAALAQRPDWPRCMNYLAFLIATHPELDGRDTKEAVRLATRACELTNYQQASLLDTLAIAYAADGRYDDAVRTGQKALELAESSGEVDIAKTIRYHLTFLKGGKPYIEPHSR